MSSASKANTLQKQCLNFVVKYFDRLIDSYETDSSVIPQKHFEFLQRVYSKVLLERLTDQDCLKDKHLNFLINPYLKVLDLRSSTFADPTVIIERLKVVGDNITCLYLQEQHYGEDKIIEIINSVPHAEELYLHQTGSADRVLKAIGKNCKQLCVLDMSSNEMAGHGLESLCTKRKNGDFMPNMLLKKIHITNCGVYSESVMFCLKNFPNLEVLDHENLASTIYKEHKKHFHRGDLQNQPKYKLTKLYFSQFRIGELPGELTDALLVCAILCPNVTVLYVANLSTPSSVIACSNFTQLLDVELQAERLHPQDFSPFLIAQGAFLTSLKLKCGTVSLDVLTKSCQNLESLCLTAMKIDSSSSDEKTVFSKLKSITFQTYKFLENEVEPIISLVKASPETEVLRFPYCRLLTDQFVSSLLACKCMANIKKLDFGFSDLTEASIRKFIFSMPSLEEIIIDGCVTSLEYESLLDSIRAESLAVDVVFNFGSDYGYDIDYGDDHDVYDNDDVYGYDSYDIDHDADDVYGYDNYDIDLNDNDDVYGYDNYDIDLNDNDDVYGYDSYDIDIDIDNVDYD